LEPGSGGVIEVLSLCQSGVNEEATKPSQDIAIVPTSIWTRDFQNKSEVLGEKVVGESWCSTISKDSVLMFKMGQYVLYCLSFKVLREVSLYVT